MDPQNFYFIKGLISMVGVVLVVIHMNISWGTFDRDINGLRTGVTQRLRYLSWFLFIMLIAGASYEQRHEDAAINGRNVAALIVVTLATFTALVSIVEARRKVQRRH